MAGIKKGFSRECVMLRLVLCSLLFMPACWAFGEDGLRQEPGRTGATGNTVLPVDQDCTELAGSQEKPRIAIIIDDMGNQQQIGAQLLDLDMNLTFSFLPYAPFTGELEEDAWARGRDILVHMPMEPKDPQWDPGPDALHVNDSLTQLTLAVEKNVALVPHAIGVNNHMGSQFTEDRFAMHQFLGIIRQKGMFFVDSATSEASIGMEEAHEMGIKTARRHVFLDNSHSQQDICRQLEELIKVAGKNGWAIGIGHSNEATLKALDHCRDRLLQYVRLVGVHELIN
jgi:polysaccharide deacetylase 2 family uncharacterized protein YibQ